MSTANAAMTEEAPVARAKADFDSCGPLQMYLVLDMVVRTFIWSSAFALATAAVDALHIWPKERAIGSGFTVAWMWGQVLGIWIVLFNYAYLMVIVVLKLLVPTPREGVYPVNRKMKVLERSGDRQLIKSAFISTLTKARYQAPFPAFLVFQVSSVAPMRWLMGPIFGPRSKSCNVTDPLILDPPLVEIGRNVVIGSNASIAGHIQVPNMVQLKKTRIEDDVLIGANSVIFGGVTLKRGCMVAAGSVVPPYTTVGEYEYWSGVPAVKVRKIEP